MNTIIEFFKKDWSIKLVMLLLAFALWFYVSAEQVRTGDFPGAVNIETRNVPSGTVALLSEDYAVLKLSADEDQWEQLQPDSLEVYVDLEGLDVGTHEVRVQTNSLVDGVEILSVQPKTVFVNIEPIVTREIPISVIFDGDPGEGYIVGSYSISPETISLSAARSVVADIDQVTAEVVLDGETESFERSVELQAPNFREDIILNPSSATVTVNIVQSGQNKTAGVKPSITGTPADGYFVSSVTVQPSTISLNGASSVLSTISNISTEDINTDGLDEDTTVTVSLILPDGVTSDTNEVQVKISIDKVVTP